MVFDEVLVSPVADEVQFVKGRIAAIGHVVALRIPAAADREHVFARAPALRALATDDLIEGDEAVMDRVTSLLADRVRGGSLAAPYAVLAEQSAEGG